MGRRDKFSREEKKLKKGAAKPVSPILTPLPEVEVARKKGKKEEEPEE